MPRITNFPQKPTRAIQQEAFPSDLILANRQFYTEINFIDYKSKIPQGVFRLPMPRRINDNQVIQWQEWSALDQAGKLMDAGLSQVGISSTVVAGVEMGAQAYGVYAGIALNPWMYMMFKRPGFKEFTFQWAFAPNSQQESQTVNRIIKAFKKASLPPRPGWVLQDYPSLAQVKFHPADYLFPMKPCAIISVQVDHTGAGIPSFFKSGAPTVVNLSVQLKEIELWNKEEIN